MPTRQGAIRLCRFAGIDLFLHWSWFLVAAFEIGGRSRSYTSFVWNALEYLGLFVLVSLHEFGHALACRSVGGEANQIVLWPLGGVAYVNPPQRPGAVLWSIAAGPLVNLILLPVLLGLWLAGRSLGWAESAPDAYALVRVVAVINISLLVFNLLPVYPLDGGQILRALLWFFLGRSRSLLVATVIGFAGVAGLVALAIWFRSIWLGILAAFIFGNCWRGFQQARAINRLDQAPRHADFACPSCQAAPPRGAYWVCGRCRQAFDTFATHAVCPQCQTTFAITRCLDCGTSSPFAAWAVPPLVPPA